MALMVGLLFAVPAARASAAAPMNYWGRQCQDISVDVVGGVNVCENLQGSGPPGHGTYVTQAWISTTQQYWAEPNCLIWRIAFYPDGSNTPSYEEPYNGQWPYVWAQYPLPSSRELNSVLLWGAIANVGVNIQFPEDNDGVAGDFYVIWAITTRSGDTCGPSIDGGEGIFLVAGAAP